MTKKFRAWHVGLNKMFSAEEMGEDQLTLSVDGRGFINVHGRDTKLSIFAGEKMVPLQFTGLKDSKGVEIYEGDILNWDAQDQQPAPEVVRLVPGGFVAQHNMDEGETTGGSLWVNRDSIKTGHSVVGNIYENPELMTPKNYYKKSEATL